MERTEDDVLRRRGVVTRPGKREWRFLTTEEAVVWLLAWRDYNVAKYNLHFPTMRRDAITSGVEHVYLTGMIREMIEMVRNSNDDPVTTVAEYYYQMDRVLFDSGEDHVITQRFAGYLARASRDVLLFLKNKEKEMNRE